MIRFAEEKDLTDVLRMARSFHKESPYSSLTFSQELCESLFYKYLSGSRSDMMILLAEDERVFGMIVGLRSTVPFSLDTVTTELVWWVDHDKRKSRESLLLFKAYEEWSRRVGAKITQMGMLDSVTDLSGFYKKHGYECAEQLYIRKI